MLDKEGVLVGVVSLKVALSKAHSNGLDLLEISPNASPPVCKIVDFNQYKYELKKYNSNTKKTQKRIGLKEMKFKINISSGDFDIKVKKIRNFLSDGNKVKISVWFKGREIVYQDQGKVLLKNILDILKDIGKLDSNLQLEGKQMMMIMAPL